jgi:DNA-directed RNA polymerase
MEMGYDDNCFSSQMVRQNRNSYTYRNRNSYNCSQQSRDEHRTFKTSQNFQQRWTLDLRKTVKLSVQMSMGLQKNNLKLSAEIDIMGLYKTVKLSRQ